MANAEFRLVKAKARQICKQRRMRIQEFMKPFDTHRQRKIKSEQFKRALDMSGLRLLEDEVNCIILKYRNAADASYIDYQRFCDLIDKVFTTKGLEARPQLQNICCQKSDPEDNHHHVSLTETELNILSSIKGKLQALIMTNGIILKDEFFDFDRNNSGFVTKTRFIRTLMDLVPLTDKELDILLKAYGKDSDVNYRALHRSLLQMAQGLETLDAPSGSSSLYASTPAIIEEIDFNALSDLENCLVELAQRRRFQVKDQFLSVDQLRTGTCTCDQFRRCVKSWYSAASSRELSMLTQKYASMDKNTVDYARFLDRIVGKAMHDKDVLTNFLCGNNDSIAEASRLVKHNLNNNLKENLSCDNLLRRLALECTRRRLLLRPAFQDFDRSHRDYVTAEQFFRVLFAHKLAVSSEDRNILMKEYVSSHGDRFLNYARFCIDLVRYEAESLNDRNTTFRPTSRGITSEILVPVRLTSVIVNDVECRSLVALMTDFQDHLKQYRIRLGEFFCDHDKLRHGLITFAKFCSGINAIGLVLNHEEMNILSEAYASPIKDAQGRSLVNWKQFAAEIEANNKAKDLEPIAKHGIACLADTNSPRKTAQQKHLMTREEVNEVDAAIAELGQKIERDRLEIKYVLEDFDPSRRGVITSNNFERALTMSNLLPKASLLRLYILRFAKRYSSETEANITAIDYRAFLRALNAANGICSTTHTNLIESSSRNPPQNPGKKNKGNVMNLESVVAYLRQQIVVKRIRLKDFITEGDKLRSGEITVSKFCTALSRSGFTLNANDIETLTMQFRSSQNLDKIDWRVFLEALGPINFDNVQQQPQRNEQFAGVDVKQILERLALVMKSKRLDVKSHFQSFDRCRHLRVKKHQFAAVLDMMKFGLLPSEVDALSAYFSNQNGYQIRSNLEVDYMSFVRAIDANQQ